MQTYIYNSKRVPCICGCSYRIVESTANNISAVGWLSSVLVGPSTGLGVAPALPKAMCTWLGGGRGGGNCPMYLRTDVPTYSARCAHGPTCPLTQPDVPTYSARCTHGQTCPLTQPMCPRTDVPTYSARCGYLLSPMCPRTDVPTYSAPCAHHPAQ